MTQKEMIAKIVKRSEGRVSPKQVETVLVLVSDLIVTETAASEHLRIPTLGTFKLINCKARTGRNPKTRETIQIPACRTIRFNPTPENKARLNS